MQVNGAKLQRIREEKGWTRKELATALNVTEAMIYQAEQGENTASPVAISRIRKWLQQEDQKQTETKRDDELTKAILMLLGNLGKETAVTKEETPIKKGSMTLGVKLQEIREEKGLSRSKVCSVIGINYSTLQYWEQGKHIPSKNLLKRIATYYDVNLKDLVCLLPEKQKKIYRTKKRNYTKEVTTNLTETEYARFNMICDDLTLTKAELLRRLIVDFDFTRYYKKYR